MNGLSAATGFRRCEMRTLEDIRALGGNDPADERRFETVDRVSQTNLALYRTYAQPIVRAFVNAPAAQWMRRLNPLRLQYEMFSNANPLPHHRPPDDRDRAPYPLLVRSARWL
jgi:hypothetical protein